MASLNCIACAMQDSAFGRNSGASGARSKSFGSFPGSGFFSRELSNAISIGLKEQLGCRVSSSGRSRSSSAGGLPLRWPGGGVWFGDSVSEKTCNSPTWREKSVVCANANRRNFLFQLGDDGGFDEEGPIELPPRELEIDPLAFPEASPLQIAASSLLTGTIGVLLVRSLRRRADRAKEMKFRSTGVSSNKSIKEDARKAAVAKLTQAPEVPVPPPSPAQTFLGAAVAGVIALGLYKFTTTVEGSFVGKPVSMNYSIRNLTVTVRTIVNGLLYLATFVFAANSIGLALYSIQLLLGGNSSPDPNRAEPLEKGESSSDGEKSSEAEDEKN